MNLKMKDVILVLYIILFLISIIMYFYIIIQIILTFFIPNVIVFDKYISRCLFN